MLRKSLLLHVSSIFLATFAVAGEYKEWCGEKLGPATDREGSVSEFVDVDFLWILDMDTKALVYVTFGPRFDENPAFESQSVISLVASKQDDGNHIFNAVEMLTEGMGYEFDDLRVCEHSQSTEFVHFKEAINLIKNPKVHQCLANRPLDRKCIDFLWKQFDVAGKREVLSKAELSRLIRTVGIISTFFDMESKRTDGIPFKDLEQNQILLFTYSDAFADFLINSMDYNSDGKLSMDEILHDRTLGDWIAAIRSGKLSSTFLLANIQSGLVDVTNELVESHFRPTSQPFTQY